MGKSAKILLPHDFSADAPMVIQDPDSDRLLSDPQAVKNGIRRYFQKLFQHADPPQLPKPWLSSPSVLDLRNRLLHAPFHWPQPLTLDQFRSLLRRGNPRPSPGPDGWEKWCIKALLDNALSLVLDLVNYEFTTSSFPGPIKHTIMVTIHKRGVSTVLANKRGVTFSNFLCNMPFAWLSLCLNQYNASHQLLPQGQIATQQGVQSRDLLSFLAQVESWSFRTKTPLYILKRDQQKGFDFLSPSGFHDAVRAYGLPESLIHLDTAAQSDVQCRIRTAYGDTEPIVISGVTKQGGPISPLKSALTTSLGHRWISDHHCVLIQTQQARSGDPHSAADFLSISFSMVEATDDSLLFSTSLDSLAAMCFQMEKFQFAYGWVTAWPKSELVALNHRDCPSYQPLRDMIPLPSINLLKSRPH